MIKYNEYDIEWAEGFDEILKELGGTPPDNDEVFDFMCETKIDIASNAYYEIVLSQIESLAQDKYRYDDFSYYVNARDTNLYVNDEQVNDWEDFEGALSEDVMGKTGMINYELFADRLGDYSELDGKKVYNNYTERYGYINDEAVREGRKTNMGGMIWVSGSRDTDAGSNWRSSDTYIVEEDDTYAKGGSLRRTNAPLLRYTNYEDGWRLNLVKLNPFRNQSGLRYKGNYKYGISRQGPGKKQEVWQFETLKEADKKYDELVELGKTYSKIEKKGKIEANYAKGGEIGEYIIEFKIYETDYDDGLENESKDILKVNAKSLEDAYQLAGQHLINIERDAEVEQRDYYGEIISITDPDGDVEDFAKGGKVGGDYDGGYEVVVYNRDGSQDVLEGSLSYSEAMKLLKSVKQNNNQYDEIAIIVSDQLQYTGSDTIRYIKSFAKGGKLKDLVKKITNEVLKNLKSSDLEEPEYLDETITDAIYENTNLPESNNEFMEIYHAVEKEVKKGLGDVRYKIKYPKFGKGGLAELSGGYQSDPIAWKIIEQMEYTRKPTSIDEVSASFDATGEDETLELISYFPAIKAKDLNELDGKLSGIIQYYVLYVDDVPYLIDTQGYDYAKYVTRIHNLEGAEDDWGMLERPNWTTTKYKSLDYLSLPEVEYIYEELAGRKAGKAINMLHSEVNDYYEKFDEGKTNIIQDMDFINYIQKEINEFNLDEVYLILKFKLEIEKLKKENPEGFKREIKILESRLEEIEKIKSEIVILKRENPKGFKEEIKSLELRLNEIKSRGIDEVYYAKGGMTKPRLKKGDKVEIYGKRWFQKSYGNTYHVTKVYVNGVDIGESEQQYGYDEQYLQTGAKILWNKYNPPYKWNMNKPLWMLRNYGIDIYYSVTDVEREKDLWFSSRRFAKGGIIEDDFYEIYKPIKNKFDDDAPWSGNMFETYGEELEFVRQQPKENIWTITEDGDTFDILPGFHLVNRWGYLVTEKKWKTGDEYIIMDEDWAKGGKIKKVNREDTTALLAGGIGGILLGMFLGK